MLILFILLLNIKYFKKLHFQEIRMATQIDIDTVDVKILYALIKNARTSAKTIADECNVSKTAIINRINRLKESGIIKGSVLFLDLEKTKLLYPFSIEIENIKNEETEKIIEILNERSNVVLHSFSSGKSALTIFFVAKSDVGSSNLKDIINKYVDNGKISVSDWKSLHIFFDNIVIEPNRGNQTEKKSQQ